MDAAHDTGTRSATSSQCTAQSSQRCLAFLQRRAVLLPYSRAGSPSSLPASAAPCRPPILIQCCHAILLTAPATPHPSSPASTPTLPRCHSTSTPADPEEWSMIAAFMLHVDATTLFNFHCACSHICPPMARLGTNRLLRLPPPSLSSAAGRRTRATSTTAMLAASTPPPRAPGTRTPTSPTAAWSGAGDSSAAVVRIGGAEWVVRRRSVRSAAAGGESPGDTVHRSVPQVEHVHNGDGLHAERRRFRPQRAVPGACIGPRAAPDFEVGGPAAYECYLQRRRPGDSSRAVFRAAGVELVLLRRLATLRSSYPKPTITPHANLAQLIRSLNCLPSMASGPNCPIPGVLISSWHWTGHMKVPLRY